MPKPCDHIPDTISEAAREILTWAEIPTDGDPHDLAGWQRYRAAEEALLAEAIAELRDEYAFRAAPRLSGGVPCLWIEPEKSAVLAPDGTPGRLLVYLHGGGYVYGAGESALLLAGPMAAISGRPVLAVDYRLAPEHPFPAARDDFLAVYRDLLKSYSPGRLAVWGDSAGGGLALAGLLAAHAQGLPLPAALALISPWSDLSKTGDSYFTLEGYDPTLHYELNLRRAARAYAGDRPLTDPELSPIYAAYPPGFPPTLIQTGTRDLFLSNCARLQRKLLDSSIDCRLSLWEGLWHVFHADQVLPEARRALEELAEFLVSPS